MAYSKINIFLVLLLSLSGCSKYLDIDAPKDQVSSALAFSDDQSANATIVGMYTNMNAFNYQFANVLGNVIAGMSADELYYASTFASFDQFRYNSLLPSNTYIGSLWSQPYSLIYQSNACIEGLTAAQNLTPSVRNQLIGEALVVRSFCYFYLVNYFGNVPLLTKTDYQSNNTSPRMDTTIVYDTIQNDLATAELLLADDYTESGERIRPNKAVARALNARVALYRGHWAEAERLSSSVIEDGKYGLVRDLNGVFLKNSREAIWQLQSVNPGRNTWEGNIMVPVAAPLYRLYPDFVNSFDPQDARLRNWIGTYTSSTGVVSYYPYKYKVRIATTFTEYSMVLRLAEQFLIRAEARAMQGQSSKAIQDLDSVRTRAGLPLLPVTTDPSSVLGEVRKERKWELFTEWAHRWMDLKRWGIASEILAPIKPAWKSTSAYYPIPLNAMSTNAYLTQNDGY